MKQLKLWPVPFGAFNQPHPQETLAYIICYLSIVSDIVMFPIFFGCMYSIMDMSGMYWLRMIQDSIPQLVSTVSLRTCTTVVHAILCSCSVFFHRLFIGLFDDHALEISE